MLLLSRLDVLCLFFITEPVDYAMILAVGFTVPFALLVTFYVVVAIVCNRYKRVPQATATYTKVAQAEDQDAGNTSRSGTGE